VDERTKITLDESEIPRQWYNVAPDLPAPQPPPLHPGTLQPIGPQDLAPLFPMELIRQEVARCSTSTGCGGRLRCTGRGGWSRP
jgi:tryptophan synthase beta chain